MEHTQERDRLQALARFGILDSAPEGTYDRIAALLARLLDVPHACVSIVDRERVWFKTAHGLDVAQVKRQPGFCHTVVEKGELLHYRDATKDDRSRFNDLAQGENGIRFYVGAPLETSDGFRIGTLCAFAPEPRGLSAAERQCVIDLADLVMHEIEARRTRNKLERTEAVLRRSQRLESIGMVASGVAHDFNNLLGGIIGNIGLLKIETEGSAVAHEILEEIDVVAHRAADLSSQVLAYAGRADGPTDSAVDLNEIIRKTSYMIGSVIHSNTTLEMDLEPDLLGVHGDPTSLGQVVMNLITNASDAYRGEPGTVHLSTTKGSGGKVVLEVVDEGAGMDEVTRERILDAFFTTKVGGRGLGMAVVARIVQQLGGTIDVASESGVGTTIRVELPEGEPVGVPRASIAKDASDWQAAGTILVVDDEKVILNLARRTLALVGLDALTADCGAEALRLFDDHHDEIVAVIIDLSMPEMDGGEVMRAIRVIAPEVPVILSSGHLEEDVAARVGVTQLDSFLKKPFSPDAMIHAVRTAIAG